MWRGACSKESGISRDNFIYDPVLDDTKVGFCESEFGELEIKTLQIDEDNLAESGRVAYNGVGDQDQDIEHNACSLV